MKLIEVPKDEAVDGGEYLTQIKYGLMSATWDAKEGICKGYYWHDMEWHHHAFYPYVLYKTVEENENV